MTASPRRLSALGILYLLVVVGFWAFVAWAMAGQMLAAIWADAVGVVLFLAVSWFFLRRLPRGGRRG